jgi:hypothetical protein
VPQSVNLVAVDDDVDEPKIEKITINHRIDGDRLWSVVAAPTAMVAIVDNDDPVVEDTSEYGEDGIDVSQGEEGGAGRSAREAPLIDPSIGGGTGAAAERAARAGGSADGVRGDGNRITMPDILTEGEAAESNAAPGAASGTSGLRTGDGGGVRAADPNRRRPEAQPRNVEEWYAKHWKKTVPATGAAALGAGGLLFALMYDGGGMLGRRRLW